jgi:hypothetical protein
MNLFLQIIQTIAAIAGLFVAVITLVNYTRKWLRQRRNKPIADDGTASISLTRVRPENKDILDLSLSLLLAAFFSLLLLDALVVSGRLTPDLGYSFVISAVATVFLSLSFLISWLIGKLEQTIGIFSTIIFLIVIFSPNGPFTKDTSDPNLASGINLWIPIFTLIMLSVAMISYSYGNPLDKNLSRNKRLSLGGVFLAFIFLGVISLGLQFKKEILENSENLPKLTLGSSNKIVAGFKNIQSLEDERNMFKLFSEADLQDDYLSNYNTVHSELTNPDITDLISTDPSLRLPGNKDQEEEAKNRLLGQAKERSARLDGIYEYFSRWDLITKQNYLCERFKLTYPIGSKKYERPILDMPGITSYQRFQSLQKTRLACYYSTNFSSKKAIETLFYDGDITPVASDYALDDDYATTAGTVEDARKLARRKEPYYIHLVDPDKLFNPLTPKSFVARLNEQLVLPYNYEMYLAYKEYENLDSSLLVEYFKPHDDKVIDIQGLIRGLNSLPPDVKSCFSYYVVNDTTGIYDLLSDKIDLFENYITPIIGTDNNILQNITIAADTATIIRDSTSKNGKAVAQLKSLKSDGRKFEKVENLLRTKDAEYPVEYLFHQECIDLIRIIKRFTDAERKYAFENLQHPIEYSERSFIDKNLILGPAYQDQFRSFTSNSIGEREEITSRCAMDLFNNVGRYSPNFISLMIYNANSGDAFWGSLLATILCLPYVLLAVFVGNLIARKLIVRDNLRQIVLSEEKFDLESRNNAAGGTPIEMQGRTTEIKKIMDLAGRGWSAIAIVGRRGIGKSRILSELYHGSVKKKAALSVWISAPSQYSEEDFVQSAFEQVILNVENKITEILGCKPFEVRRLERRSMQFTAQIFAIFLLLTISVYLLMSSYGRVLNVQIISSWFPILLLVLASILILVYKWLNLQPLNLSSWLERDRASNPHSAILYRDTRKARSFILQRQPRNRSPLSSLRNLAWFPWLIGLFLLNILLMLIYSRLAPIYFITADLLIIGGSWLFSTRTSNQASPLGSSLMTLASTYRSYLERVVSEIRNGALGDFTQKELEVIVCIDELDKITDKKELRQFISRIKILFEIPGVYYYLSLSEDSINSMYLGVANGKNELDSAFDHLVYIPNLDFANSKQIAINYLRSNTKDLEESDLDKASTTLALISFGIPRDVLRRSDEYLAGIHEEQASENIISNFRNKLANLSFNDLEISSEELKLFTETDIALVLQSFLKENCQSERLSKIKLTLYLLTTIDFAINRSVKIMTTKDYDELITLGYKMGSTIPLGLLCSQLQTYTGQYVTNSQQKTA